MLMPYPLPFRNLVVNTYLEGAGSLADIAGDYAISISTLHAWVMRTRLTGDLAARTSPGRPSKLSPTALDVLRGLLADDSDATLPQLTRALSQRAGVDVSRQTVGRALQHMGVTRKKSPSSRRNVEVLPSSSREASSGVGSRTSTRRA
jgi:transposase